MILEQTRNNKTLTSLALLETSLISQDYLSTFIPFIATLTLKNNYKTIQLNTVVDDFKKEFGLYIPRAPMQTILARCVNKGIIKKSLDAQYYPDNIEMEKTSFSNRQDESINNVNIIINKFINYTFEAHKIELSEQNAEEMFINFLDEYSPKTISGDNAQFGEYESETPKKNLYLTGQFIKHAYSTDPSLFDSIRKLAMAHLLASAIAFDSDADNRLQEFGNLTIYLDTPIVLRLLGLQTEELEQSYLEMFKSFNETIKPKYRIFTHTFDEISQILSDCAYWIDNPDYNPLYANAALLNFIEKKFNRTQIELYINKLIEKLNDLCIEIDDFEYSYYSDSMFNYQNEMSVLKNRLIEEYRKKNPLYDLSRNEYSIDYDMKSIDSIIKLWGNKSARKYSSLGYIFLTNNSTLAYVSRIYISEYKWDGKNSKSPCVTDYYLGTMIWLSTSIQTIEGYSRLKLLADCSAATTLSREVMEKFLSELKKLQNTKGINESDYLLLRTKAFEKNYLQNITLNEEDAYQDDTTEQLLENIKIDIQKPLVNIIEQKDKELENRNNEIEVINRKLYEFELEKEKLAKQNLLKDNIAIEKATKQLNLLINTYMPILASIMAAIFVLLQFIPFFSGTVVIILKFSAACISVLFAIFIGFAKSNLLNIHKLIEKKFIKYYKVKYYKKELR